VRADVLAANLKEKLELDPVFGVARSHALGARGDAGDRSGLRHLGMARGTARTAFRDADVCAELARWALRSAYLRRSPPHLPLDAESPVRGLAVCSGGDGTCLLVAGCADGGVRVWNPATAALMATLLADGRAGVRAVGACRVGERAEVAIGREDGMVELWDPQARGDVRREFPTPHAGGVRAVAPFVLEGELAIATSGEEDARVWTGGGVLRWSLDCHGPVRALAVVDAGGIHLVAGRDDAKVGVWALPPAEDVEQVPDDTPLRGATDWIRAVVAWPQDGALAVAASGDDRRLSRWQAERLVDRGAQFEGAPTAMTDYVADGRRRIVVGADDGSLTILDAASGEPVVEAPVPAHSCPVTAVATYELASKPRVASAGADRWIRLWNVETLERRVAVPEGHRGRVLAVAAPSDGTVVTGGEDGTVRVWDWATGRRTDVAQEPGLGPIRVLAGPRAAGGNGSPAVAGGDGVRFLGGSWSVPRLDVPEAVRAAAWSPDGAELAAGGDDGVLRVWRQPHVAPGLPRAHPCDGPIRDLAWVDLGDRGTWLAIVGTGRNFRLHDRETLKAQGLAFEGHLDRVAGVCVAPGPSSELATVADDGQVFLWQPRLYLGEDSGLRPTRLGSHDGPARAIAVVGGALVSGGDDETVRVWDVATRQELIRAHVGAKVNAVCAAGHDVAVATDDGHLVMRLLDPSG
jgi:WD40 repeat protein